MKHNEDNLVVIADKLNLKNVQGIKVAQLSNTYFIFMWYENKVLIFETSSFITKDGPSHKHMNQDDKLQISELALSSRVIDIFYLNGEDWYILDWSGSLYSLQLVKGNESSSTNFMDIEDIFSSPTSNDNSEKWKEHLVMRVESCDFVITLCKLTTDIAFLASKDEDLFIFVYSLPEFKFKFSMNIFKKYTSQEATMSSCAISSLTSSMKKHFLDDLDVFDTDILIIGLKSGLVLWLCANKPTKGPFVLFSSHQPVQGIHWIKDPGTGLYNHLAVMLNSGPVFMFGGGKHTTLYLPESVRMSWCLQHYLITTNFVDCYCNELNSDEDITFTYTSLPIKGACAMTSVPGSDILLVVATIHGFVYSLNPTVKTSGDPSQFFIPDQSQLDNMLALTQNLESTYKQMSAEDGLLKAVSSTVSANNISNLFEVSVRITSGSEFYLSAKFSKEGLCFSKNLWFLCIEVMCEDKSRKTVLHQLKQDFNCDNNLTIKSNNSFSIGDLVTAELVLFSTNQLPVLVVLLGKIEIDACHLMVTQALIPKMATVEDPLGEIIENLNNEQPKRITKDCKLTIKLPQPQEINYFLSNALQDCQHRISVEEWDKISGGTKFHIQLSLNNILLQLNLEVETKELTISSSDVQLSHRVKEAIFKKCSRSELNQISENILLNIQALHQSFEIESMKDKPDFQSLEIIRRKLRRSVTSQLLF